MGVLSRIGVAIDSDLLSASTAPSPVAGTPTVQRRFAI